jgi:MFS family permease
VVSTYFQRRKGFALGAVGCGNVTGGILFPSLARMLLPSIGFKWTVRAIGFVQLATLALVCWFLRPRILARKSGPLVEWKAFRELEYVFYTAGGFFVRIFLPNLHHRRMRLVWTDTPEYRLNTPRFLPTLC